MIQRRVQMCAFMGVQQQLCAETTGPALHRGWYRSPAGQILIPGDHASRREQEIHGRGLAVCLGAQ